MRIQSAWLCIVAMLAAMSAGQVRAQTVAGSISGLVTDSSGAVIPGAAVEVTDIERSVSVQTTSNGGVADHFVTQMLRQGESGVFKRYSQAKLGMMRSKSWTVRRTSAAGLL